jgi:hypothetical protein
VTESEWLASADPAAMLRLFVGTRGERGRSGMEAEPPQPPLFPASDRKLRLFACACCRQVWDGAPCPRCGGKGQVWDDDPRLGIFDNYRVECPSCHGTGRVGDLVDPRSRRAVEVAERYADGLATEAERLAADRESADAVRPYNDMSSPAWIAQASAGLSTATELAWEVVRRPHAWLPPATQATLLREVFGNPFRPPWALWEGMTGDKPAEFAWRIKALQPLLHWHDGTVPSMAQRIYDERRWDDMPILADALIDAGCEDGDLLRHCRGEEWCDRCGGLGTRKVQVGRRVARDRCLACDGTGWQPLRGPHARGCWAVDLILGKN